MSLFVCSTAEQQLGLRGVINVAFLLEVKHSIASDAMKKINHFCWKEDTLIWDFFWSQQNQLTY